MRAPELQLIDRLEKLKNELKEPTPVIAISLSEYQRNLFPTLKDKISEADTTDADNTKKSLDLIKDAFTITLNLVNALIARANSVPALSVAPVMDSSDSDAEVEDTRMSERGF